MNVCFNFFLWFFEDFVLIFFYLKESNYFIFFDGICNLKFVFVFDDDDSNWVIKNFVDVDDYFDIVSI